MAISTAKHPLGSTCTMFLAFKLLRTVDSGARKQIELRKKIDASNDPTSIDSQPKR